MKDFMAEIALKIVEKIESFANSRQNDNNGDNRGNSEENKKKLFDDLASETKKWNALILSSGLFNTLLFGFSKAIEKDVQRYLSLIALAVLDVENEATLDSVRRKVNNLDFKRNLQWDEVRGLLQKIVNIDVGIQKQEEFQMLLTHLSRLLSVKAYSLERSREGNE